MYIWLLLFVAATTECRIQFLAIGDWGDTSFTRQVPVAEAMDNFCSQNQCDFIVSTGDNFYMDGVESPDDPKFDDSWRNVYDGEYLKDLVWYISLGNHDHTLITRNELNQVEFGETEPRWHLPWLWYDAYIEVDEDTKLHLITIDSEAMWTRKYNASAQEIWAEDLMVESVGDYLIVLAHHPCYSTGDYFGNIVIRDFLDGLFEEYQVDVYLTGHDHNLQHINQINATGYPTDHVISGGGGRRPYGFSNLNNQLINNAGYESIYFGELNGFTSIDIDSDKMTITHYTYVIGDDEVSRPEAVHSFVRPRVRSHV